MRKTIIRPERNGYVYVLDRTIGEVLAADAYVHITASHGVDLKTGRLMKNPDMIPQFKTGSGIIGQPTTFRGPDGRQYVAILSGVGGWVGSIVTNNPDPRDPSAQKGFANMTGELKKITQPGGMLYVFALPRP